MMSIIARLSVWACEQGHKCFCYFCSASVKLSVWFCGEIRLEKELQQIRLTASFSCLSTELKGNTTSIGSELAISLSVHSLTSLLVSMIIETKMQNFILEI